MKALKALVIGMGLMIVIAVILLGYGLYKKSVEPGWKLFGPQRPPTPATSATAAPTAFGLVDLGVDPVYCRIESVHPDGARVYFRIGGLDTCQQVIVADPATGAILGRFKVGQ